MKFSLNKFKVKNLSCIGHCMPTPQPQWNSDENLTKIQRVKGFAPFPSTRSPLEFPLSIKCDHHYWQQTTRVAADIFCLLSASVARYLSVKCGNWQQRAEITSRLRPIYKEDDALLWQQFVPQLYALALLGVRSIKAPTRRSSNIAPWVSFMPMPVFSVEFPSHIAYCTWNVAMNRLPIVRELSGSEQGTHVGPIELGNVCILCPRP